MIKPVVFITMLLIVAASASADVLIVGKTRYKGTFRGFENNSFEFDLQDGNSLKKNRSMVNSLELEKPVKASYLERGKKTVEDVEFLGYDKLKFLFSDNSKEIGISGSVMKNITVSWSYSGGDGGLPSSETPTPPPLLDLSKIEGAQLTPEQQTALSAYKAARAEYDKYLAESTALVKQMDASKNEKREQLLSKLRIRKQDEQPILASLQQATDNILAVFPRPDK